MYGVGKSERDRERERASEKEKERDSTCSRCSAKSLDCYSFDAFKKKTECVRVYVTRLILMQHDSSTFDVTHSYVT